MSEETITIKTKKIKISELKGREEKIYNGGWWDGYNFRKDEERNRLFWMLLAVIVAMTLIIKIF